MRLMRDGDRARETSTPVCPIVLGVESCIHALHAYMLHATACVVAKIIVSCQMLFPTDFRCRRKVEGFRDSFTTTVSVR